VKSRGILFTARMVRAILEGRKTQTRRPVTLPKGYELDGQSAGVLWFPPGQECAEFEDGPLVLCSRPNGSTGERRMHCPYGKAGDRLWVRETWQIVYDGCPYGCECWGECFCVEHDEPTRGTPANGCKHASIAYRATDTAERLDMGPDGYEVPMRWRPSLLMPRWASRLTLEAERVRVKHVQDISEADAAAEGIEWGQAVPSKLNGERATLHYFDADAGHRRAFAGLWDSIHSRKPGRSWADNPLVWAITFHVVPQSTTQCHEASP
jgi:hypothetical protein